MQIAKFTTHPDMPASQEAEEALIATQGHLSQHIKLALAFSSERARQGRPAAVVIARFEELNQGSKDIWRELDPALLGMQAMQGELASGWLSKAEQALLSLCQEGEAAEARIFEASGLAKGEEGLEANHFLRGDAKGSPASEEKLQVLNGVLSTCGVIGKPSEAGQLARAQAAVHLWQIAMARPRYRFIIGLSQEDAPWSQELERHIDRGGPDLAALGTDEKIAAKAVHWMLDDVPDSLSRRQWINMVSTAACIIDNNQNCSQGDLVAWTYRITGAELDAEAQQSIWQKMQKLQEMRKGRAQSKGDESS